MSQQFQPRRQSQQTPGNFFGGSKSNPFAGTLCGPFGAKRPFSRFSIPTILTSLTRTPETIPVRVIHHGQCVCVTVAFTVKIASAELARSLPCNMSRFIAEVGRDLGNVRLMVLADGVPSITRMSTAHNRELICGLAMHRRMERLP
jgi:hypothetical protein